MKSGDGDREPETLFEVLCVTVDEVIWALIALMNQWIVHVDHFDTAIGFREACNTRVLFPNRIGGRANVRLKLPGIGKMEIANSRREHQNVTRALAREQDEPSHVQMPAGKVEFGDVWGQYLACCFLKSNKISLKKIRVYEVPQ